MKILHLTTHLNRGGITSYILLLAKAMIRRGHQVFIASSGGDLDPEFQKSKAMTVAIPLATKNEMSISAWRSLLMLRAFLRRNPVDIIHAHTRVAQVVAFWLSRQTKTPYLATCHGFFKPRWHRRLFPCWGQRTIAISTAVKEHLMRDFKVPAENIELIHSGIALDVSKMGTAQHKNDVRQHLGLSPQAFVVGSIARFSIVKGLEFLIQAAPAVLKKFPHVQFLFIGSGKEEEALKECARRCGVEAKVIFYHPDPQSDTMDYFGVFDIFVAPSLQEGLGLSILEAQAHHVAVIASRVGGIVDIITDHQNGILVEPSNAEAVSRAILELLKSDTLRETIANNAYQTIQEKFNLERMVDETESVYRKTIAEAKDVS